MAGAIEDDAIGLRLFAHMRQRGRDVMVVAEQPDGARRNLLCVPNFNFGMQESYVWPRSAMVLAKGTTMHVLAHFDNSSWNPANPDPKREVPCGPAITDECLQVSLVWHARDEQLGIRVDPSTGRRVAAAADK
jgi:hypothetical protein